MSKGYKKRKNPINDVCKCGNTSWLCDCPPHCECGCALTMKNPMQPAKICNCVNDQCQDMLDSCICGCEDRGCNCNCHCNCANNSCSSKNQCICNNCQDNFTCSCECHNNNLKYNPLNKSFEERIASLKRKAANGDIPSIQKLQLIRKIWKRAKEGDKKAKDQIRAWKTKYQSSLKEELPKKYQIPQIPQIVKDLTPQQGNVELRKLEEKVQRIYQELWEKAEQTFPRDFEKYKNAMKKLLALQGKKMDEIIARISYPKQLPQEIEW